MKSPGRPLILSVWLALLVSCLFVILRTHFIADLSAFMPQHPNQRQQLLVEQFRDGAIARTIMIGIEGDVVAERARLSRELAAGLRKNPAFVGVQNGDAAMQDRDRAYFFDNRYLLSPAVNAESFSREGLRRAISDMLDTLAGNGGLIIKRILPRDPTGEALQIAAQFANDTQPRILDGVWAARDGTRTLLLAQTRAAGSDTDGQASAIEAIQKTFDQIPSRRQDTRLVISGTGVFSVFSRNLIEHEVRRLATASIILVVGLLLWVYRSVTLLAIGLLPVASGALAGIAAVSLVFGYVHGLTLGFGTTLIGEAVDYSIYFFIQHAGGVNPPGFWRTIRLGVLTSIAGFAVLLCSSFPGLAQLGLYSISGLIVAALVTRYVLPTLVPRQIVLRDLATAGIWLEWIIRRASRLRGFVALTLLGAGAIVMFHAGDIWNRQLAALNPVSSTEQQMDQELRRDMGVSDMRYMATFTAPDQETALQEAERAGLVLQGLVEDKIIGGFNSPALVLPSVSRQRARQAALPDSAQARSRLAFALVGQPIRLDLLKGFLSDVQAARTRQPLGRDDLRQTSAGLLLDTLLIKRDNDYLVLLPLHSTETGAAGNLIDLDKVSAALDANGLSNIMTIDILKETTLLFNSYLREALILSGLGCLTIIGLLLLTLRSLSRTLRVVIPLAGAVLCVTAALLATGTQLTILHLVGLLLVVALGSNYALFFDSGMLSGGAGNQRQSQVSLVVANLTTVGSFGLLGLSKLSVLSAIGTTVAPGAFLALFFSAILAQFNADHRAD
ncbi:MAG: MMPL family transporter [Sulfuricaulis sp.]